MSAALEDQPTFAPALIGLAEIYLQRQDWPTFDSLLTRLGASPDAQILRARRHLALREFRAAHDLLRTIISESPHDLWPRVLLSHVLLQEGTDLPAAEQALLDILALAPNHAEATRNLATLRRRMIENDPEA